MVVKNSTDSKASHQLLTFQLEKHIFAVDVLQLREILRFTPPTPVPRAPSEVAGMMNLRGKIIVVFDLRALFGLPAASPTPASRILVVEREGRAAGLWVDRVLEVKKVSEQDFRPPPDMVETSVRRYLTHVVESPTGLELVLDVSKIWETKGEAVEEDSFRG